jgi:NitT/TauT family transport system substrate-binding protein
VGKPGLAVIARLLQAWIRMKPTSVLFAIVALVAAFSAGCAKKAGTEAAVVGEKPPFKIVVQLDWVAEPEHGGFYAAQQAGFFRDEHLDVKLLQGGPNAYALQKVGTGQVQLAQADSTNALLAAESGAKIVSVASIFQHDPSVLMMQQGCPVNTWTDLNGKTIMARPEWAFIPYLRKKYHLSFSVIPQNYDLGRLAHDVNLVQQGYYIAEPYQLAREHVELKFLYAWDTGFDSYTTLLANRAFAHDHPAELRAFLRALQRGYARYFGGDPGAAHAEMLRINPKATPDYLAWSRRQILKAKLDRAEGGQYLDISLQRYQVQIAQLEELGVLKPGSVKAEQAMDGQYLDG